LKIIEKVIKEKGGTYKLVNKPTLIGAHDDKDLDELKSKMQDDIQDAGSSNEEDNEEGINIDLGDEDEEEKKEEKKEKKTKGKKKAADSDDEEDSS